MTSKAFGIFLSALLGVSTLQAVDGPPAASAPAGPAPAPAAAPVTKPAATPAEAYQAFLEQMVSPQNMTDLVAKMDAVIDEADNANGQGNPGQSVARADTRNGIHLEFSVVHAPEAILYYAGLWRKDYEPFKFQEATLVLALFCNRVGLTHPIHITEGEKPVFHAQWLIKPTEWKAMRKKMLEVRAANRAEKNLYTAMHQAVTEEVDARVTATQAKNNLGK